jgi:hypothetical protein
VGYIDFVSITNNRQTTMPLSLDKQAENFARAIRPIDHLSLTSADYLHADSLKSSGKQSQQVSRLALISRLTCWQ